MQTLDDPGHDTTEFAVTLGTLLRSATESGVDVGEPQHVPGARGGYYWSVEISRVDGAFPTDRDDSTRRDPVGRRSPHALEGSDLDRTAFVATLGALGVQTLFFAENPAIIPPI
jgi:hypothetical protein